MKTTLNKIALLALLSTCFMPRFLMAQACPGLGTLNLNVVAAPEPTLNAPAEICQGVNAVISVNGSFSSYAWNVGGSTSSITINNGGNYVVTVTNSAGCTGTAAAVVDASTVVPPAIAQEPYGCNGTVVLDAGAGYNQYAWSNGGGSNQTASFSSAGTYAVTVTNATGCTSTDNIVVTIPAPPVVNITGGLTFCDGLSTTLNATAGFTSYSWTSGGAAASEIITAAGTYTVTATDGFGCTDTQTATVSTLPSPAPLVNDGEVCIGGVTTLSVTNPPFQSYSWSTGSTTGSTSVNSAGLYTVTVTASNGCTGTIAAQVTTLPQPNPNISQAPYACNGQITLSADAGFTNYSWSNGSSSASITVNNSANYSITVTNSDGCTASEIFAVTIPAPPVVNITGDPNFCTGNTADLEATPGFSTYSWSNGASGAAINVISAGQYTVTATDAFGCTDTGNFSVAELPAPTPVVAGATTICDGLSTVYSTTSSFPNYSWSTGQNSATIAVTDAGTYTVTVTAANGCTGTDTQTLDVNPSPQPGIAAAPYACDDQLTLNAGGGFSTYNWSNGSNAASITTSISGSYTVTVTNAQGCTGTDNFFADIPVAPAVFIDGASVLCQGSVAALTATVGFDQYVWSNNATESDITIINGGNYAVTVTDGFGCTASNNIIVSELVAPTPNISGPSQICATSEATFSVPGNFSSFAWSTGANTPTITVNAANTYTVTITAANGCTGTDSQELTLSTTLQPQITASPYNCDGQIILDAGAGFASYNWTGGASTQSITVSADGDYAVSVTDASGCTGSALVSASIPLPPVVSIAGDNVICSGESSILSATPGLSAYNWSNGASGENISATAAGNYTVTATDAFGCTATSGFTLTTNPAPQPEILGPSVICTNSSGVLEITGSFSQYNWSTGESSNNITISAGNTYAVTVSDAQGCTGTDNIVVSQVTALAPVVTPLPYACNGAQTLDAGTGFSSYAWSTGGNTNQIVVTSAGDYTVTVTDASGCTGTALTTTTIPAPPLVNITGDDVICTGENTVLNASSGLNAYSWSNGDTSMTITTNVAGAYSVVATDAFGCTASNSFTVNISPTPVPSIAGPSVICTNNSGVLTVNGSFTTYSWSTGETTGNITINAGNTYAVTVTDAQGCIGSDTLTVTQVTQLNPSVSQLPYNCSGAQILDAGAGFATYQWSNGANTRQVSVVNSGDYSVTVTDASGCTGSGTLNTTVPVQPDVQVTGITTFCQNTGTTLDATTGFTQYLWSTGDTTSTITPVNDGTYTVTITDNLGCTDAASIVLTAQPLPLPQLSGSTAICAGASTALSVVQSFTTYNWSSGASTASIVADAAGTFTVTVTDANGCTGVASTAVAVNQNPVAAIVEAPYTCNGSINLDAGAGFSSYNWSGPNGFSSNIATPVVNETGTYILTVSDGNGCSATTDLTVTVPALPVVQINGATQFCTGNTVSLSADAGFDTYSWSNGDGNISITTNIPGAYTVTATDALGCTATAAVVVSTFPDPAPVISGPQSVCPGNNATLTVTGNFTGYSWNSGETTAAITVLPPYNGAVTVTDANGCTATIGTNVGVSTQLLPNIIAQPYTCNGQITLDAGSGFPNYTWSNNASSSTVTISQSGTYSVTVSDGNGCSGTATIQATVPAIPSVTIDGAASICIGQTTQLTATAGFNTYNWSNGNTSSSLVTNQPGSYQVTITDGNGCTDEATFEVTLGAGLSTSIEALPYNCDGQITVNAGTGFAQYNWSNTGSTPSISVSQSGNYVVTVTDASGCTGTASILVDIPPTPVVNIAGTALICPGASTTLSATSGFTTYSWNTNANTANVTVQTPGTYAVVATDANGCTTSASFQVAQAPPATASISGGGVICDGTSATLTVTGSTGQYQWQDGSNGNSLTAAFTGSYSVTVTDANGCAASASTILTVAPPILTTVTNTSCRPQEAGTQQFTFNAASGCDSVVTVTTTYQPTVPGLALDMTPQIEAEENELITLDVAANFPIDSVAFETTFELSCVDCLDPSLTATESGDILVLAFNPEGCQATTVVQILVNKALNIYVPNAFQPGSAENGFFSVFSGQNITAVKNFNVFDRWGNALFQRKDMPTNDPSAGWDGTFRGQRMQPGVYVYFFEVTLKDGSVELFSGDVSILE